MNVIKKLVIKTNRLTIRLPEYKDIDSIINYYWDNKEYLRPYEPIKPDNFYTKDYWLEHVDLIRYDFNEGKSLKLFIFANFNSNEIIGMINLNNIVKGAFHACYLGYSLAESRQGNGYMTEALNEVIEYAFNELKIHRIMANYMPHNRRSSNVLKRLGFTIEGYAREYLYINGRWEDHILASITNPRWIEEDY